jgi:exonuclease SbcC
MKPLWLEFNSFGSYPGKESVDFSALTELGLYVVTGPTGSGKTTIFDAMAYALYGEVPGARDKGDVRSQHASAEATSSVVFRFEVNGIAYRVARTPEQFKPNAKGKNSLTKVTAKASLVRESDDEALASGSTNVTKACVDLVGLEAKQFERVVLLPQGQFQEFLLANTSVRLPLLRQLFATGRWSTVVEELKSQSGEAKSVVAGIQDELRQHAFAIRGSLDVVADLLPQTANDDAVDAESIKEAVDGVDEEVSDFIDRATLDLFEHRLEDLERQIAPIREEGLRLTEAANGAIAAHTKALSIIETWNKRTQLQGERKVLDEQTEAIDELRRKGTTARNAEPVLAAYAKEQQDANEVLRSRSELAKELEALCEASEVAGLGALRDPDSAANALVSARSRNDKQRDSVNALALASHVLADLKERRKRLREDHNRCARRGEEITSLLLPLQGNRAELETLASTEPKIAGEVEKVTELIQQREELFEIGAKIPFAQENLRSAATRQSEAIRAFDDSAAPRLAESLLPGKACPVCGSIEHPQPAVSDGDTKVDSAERDAATKALISATQELDRLGKRQEDLIDLLGDSATRSIEELRAELGQLNDDHLSALNAKTMLLTVENEIESVLKEQADLADRLNSIDLEHAGIEPQIVAAEAKCDEERSGLGELSAAWDLDPSAAISALDAIAVDLHRVEELVAASRELIQLVTTAEATAFASASTLVSALSASSFLAVADAQAVALPADELAQIDRVVEEFEKRDDSNRTLLQENLKIDLPADRPDIAELEQVVEATRASAERSSNNLGQLTGHLDLARTNLNDAIAIDAGSGDASERSKALESLAKTCDGQGPKKIALETWILAGELERVAAAANHHLGKMTNGRYQIERSDDSGHGGRQSGLDLRVLDAHTGASRRPGSLSGGEQFQASLALALGLADVIGHGGNANGRVFEALFVDEGFGSLDPDSLDQAVDALVQIQASGRTVGVITHVEAMKESLPIGIRVERLPNGKGSTLLVRPND